MKLFIFFLILYYYGNYISASKDSYNSFISIDIRVVDGLPAGHLFIGTK